MTRLRRFSVRVLAALPLLAALDAQTPDWSGYTSALQNLPAATFSKQKVGVRGMQLSDVDKLDPRLRELIDQSRQGGDVRARSMELGATSADLRIPVMTNSADAPRANALMQEIRDLGGEISSTYDTTVWSLLPAGAIERLAASANVSYLSVQNRMEQAQTPATAGEGASVRATGVAALHKSGIRGRGVKVGIIDFGFGNYTRLQRAGKVPVPKMSKTFPASFPLENGSFHGTACAEIIHEMAPEADIYLASADGLEGSVIAAARWLISQGVDIISYSAGSSAKPTDGTGEMDRFVDSTTTTSGVVWIVSSGNSGTVHWSGKNKANKDGFIETGDKGEVGIEMVPQSDILDITVRWNDWGPDPRRPTSTQDIDAYLMQKKADGTGLEVVAKSDQEQAGNGPPLEHIHYERKGTAGKHYLLALKNAKTSRLVDVHVFVYHNEPADIAPETPVGSVMSPASASYAVGVGAWNVKTNALASYSSQGPTDDNRLKPEVAAPAGLPSAAYGDVFHGTSASCPHVAGFAALLKQAKPELKGLALREAIIRAVTPKGDKVPNSGSGYGWIDGGHFPQLAVASAAKPVAPEGTSPVGSEGKEAPAPGTKPPVAASTTPVAPAAKPPAAASTAPVTPGGKPAIAPVPAPVPARPPVARPARNSLTVPAAWGGSVPADFLDRIRDSTNEQPEFLARVTTARDSYKVGDGFKIGFKASEDCHYLLLHRSAAGEYMLLSPRGAASGRLIAGATSLLPAGEDVIEVTPPIGTEELLLLCSRQSIDLKAAAKDGKVPATLVVARHQFQISQ